MVNIPLVEPDLDGNELRYVQECVESGWVSSVGKFVDRFENEFATWLGASHAVAVSSGTAALHLALLVVGVRPGDTVIVPTFTFVAPANAIRYCGAAPKFVDAEPDYWQMDVTQIEEYLRNDCFQSEGHTFDRRSGSRIAAMLPVHILGHPVDMDPLLTLARKFNLRVVEDATESLGAKYRSTKVGLLGDLACFSFNGNKLLTTGGGGMLVGSNPSLTRHARHLSTQAKADGLEYVHDEVGFNYRLSNIQAALGCAQLEKLDAMLTKKRSIRLLYEQAIRGETKAMELQATANWAQSAHWLNSLRLTGQHGYAATRDVIDRMQQRNITTRPLWQPIHRNPPFQDPDHACAGTVAQNLYENAISLPSSVGLGKEEPRRIIQTLAKCLASVSKATPQTLP